MTLTPEQIEQQRLEAELAAQNNEPVPQTNQSIELLIQRSLGESERARLAVEQQNRELQDRLTAMEQRNNPIAQAPVPVDDTQFWAKPASSIQDMINQQINPLVGFVEDMKKQNAYLALKQSYKNQYPDFVHIEQLVDKYMTGKDITHASMQSSIREALGEMAMTGKLNAPVNNNQPNQNQNQNNQPNNTQSNAPATIPPHLRPSTSATVSVDNKEKPRPLTELERRIISETKGMTEEKFRKLLTDETKVEGWKK